MLLHNQDPYIEESNGGKGNVYIVILEMYILSVRVALSLPSLENLIPEWLMLLPGVTIKIPLY